MIKQRWNKIPKLILIPLDTGITLTLNRS